MDNPLEYSSKIKEEADMILNESGIIDIISCYGQVDLIGSYALDVMYRPDIDILVHGSIHDLSKAKEVTKQILDLDYFDELCFVNKVVPGSDKKPQGFYLQPRKKIGQNNWKFDLWLTTHGNFDDRNVALKKKLMNLKDVDGAREKIIILKDHFSNGTKYDHNLDGNRIYNAVIDNPDLSIDELIKELE